MLTGLLRTRVVCADPLKQINWSTIAGNIQLRIKIVIGLEIALKGNAFHGIGGEEFCKPRNTETKN